MKNSQVPSFSILFFVLNQKDDDSFRRYQEDIAKYRKELMDKRKEENQYRQRVLADIEEDKIRRRIRYGWTNSK